MLGGWLLLQIWSLLGNAGRRVGVVMALLVSICGHGEAIWFMSDGPCH